MLEWIYCQDKGEESRCIKTHCIIHQEALASKTLPAAMKNKLAIITRIVNFIKVSAVNSQLFAKLC